jgi:hypothetical protein
MLLKGSPGVLSCSTKKYFIPALSACLNMDLEVYYPITNFGKATGRGVIHILNMKQREPARVIIDQLDRILFGFGYPVQVHFHLYQVLIRVG